MELSPMFREFIEPAWERDAGEEERSDEKLDEKDNNE